MPCYYTGSAEGDARLAAEEQAKKTSTVITNLTQLLCEACGLADLRKASPKLRAWARQHKEIDKKNKTLKDK